MKPFFEKNYTSFLYFFILPILAIIFPLVLLPVEAVFPYPYIIEELFKTLLVLMILKISGKTLQIKIATLLGFFFSASENIFYLSSPFLYASPIVFIERFFLVSSLHIFTILFILILTQKNRLFLFPAILLAMLAHYLYNQNVLLLFH
jgi:hypothetical protein